VAFSFTASLLGPLPGSAEHPASRATAAIATKEGRSRPNIPELCCLPQTANGNNRLLINEGQLLVELNRVIPKSKATPKSSSSLSKFT
jgi:hypothetical protein